MIEALPAERKGNRLQRGRMVSRHGLSLVSFFPLGTYAENDNCMYIMQASAFYTLIFNVSGRR
jgi:hypothetical protein